MLSRYGFLLLLKSCWESCIVEWHSSSLLHRIEWNMKEGGHLKKGSHLLTPLNIHGCKALTPVHDLEHSSASMMARSTFGQLVYHQRALLKKCYSSLKAWSCRLLQYGENWGPVVHYYCMLILFSIL